MLEMITDRHLHIMFLNYKTRGMVKTAEHWISKYEELDDEEFFRNVKVKKIKSKKESYNKDLDVGQKKIEPRFQPKEYLIDEK